MADDLREEENQGDPSSVVTVRRTESVRRREAIVGWTQALANVVVPLALCFAVWGYVQENRHQRVNASDRQIELFYSEGLSESRSVLFELWADIDLEVLETPRTRSFVDQFVETVIEAQPERERAVLAAIVSIATFFDGVETCIESQRCDEGEIIAQIGAYGRDFFCLYSGRLEFARNESRLLSVGHGLARFSERLGGCRDSQ